MKWWVVFSAVSSFAAWTPSAAEEPSESLGWVGCKAGTTIEYSETDVAPDDLVLSERVKFNRTIILQPKGGNCTLDVEAFEPNVSLVKFHNETFANLSDSESNEAVLSANSTNEVDGRTYYPASRFFKPHDCSPYPTPVDVASFSGLKNCVFLVADEDGMLLRVEKADGVVTNHRISNQKPFHEMNLGIWVHGFAGDVALMRNRQADGSVRIDVITLITG